MSLFIPAFHRVPPADKLKDQFCLDVINYYVRNTRNYDLLWDKKVYEIEGYAKGEFDLRPFKRMFKSDAEKIKNNQSEHHNELTNRNEGLNKTAIGFDYECLPMIPEKLNSACAIVQKIPIELIVKAYDALAIEKKQSDVNFLKNKPKIEADMQEIADKMGLDKIDLGTTKHSSVEYSDSPFGLDLQDPDQLDIFVNLLYSLKIESAFETGLQTFADLKNIINLKLLEIKDQLKYGVSVNTAFQNSLTGLPDAEYVWPGDIETPWSELPDMSDNSHRIQTKYVTPNQLWDYFGDEIGREEDLLDLINNDKYGYLVMNGSNSQINRGNLDTFKITLKKIEVKSVDWVGVTASGAITNDEEKAVKKIWAQNTYSFWWLFNTKRVFGIKRLPFAHRTKGQESFQNFSTNIYKTHQKSAVELSIGENKKAQIADIKLTHALIKSLPPGRYVDLHFLRNALSGLQEEQSEYTLDKLILLAMEQNQIFGDSEGFDGRNDGQFKPFMDLPGGLKQELVGYANVIIAANNNISRITGINQQLTGESANPEGLVGMQKLLINSSINSLYYCTEAMKYNYQKLFSIWANVIQIAIEQGGAPKEAIVRMIGNKKANVIDSLNDTCLHQIGVFVKMTQREEERAAFQKKLDELTYKGVISAADEFLLSTIDNPRDKYAVLAVKEIRWKKEQQQIRMEQFNQMQMQIEKQGQNQLAAKQADTEGKIKQIYAKGDVEQNIVRLAASLNMSAVQLDGIIKKALQQDRNKGGVQKAVANNATKDMGNQQPAVV